MAVVAGIVAALVLTGVGPVVADGIRTQVCRITGGDNCGGTQGGGQDEEAGSALDPDPAPVTGGGDVDGDGESDVDAGDTPASSQAQLDYEAALKELQDAQAAEQADSDKAKEAAKELAKILADELGITDVLDCVTKGDMGACTETLINVLLNLVGGAAGKLAAKYGAPWKWKKAVELVRTLKKHGGQLYDGITGLIKNRKRVGKAEEKLADARKALDAEKQKKPGGGTDKPDGKPGDKPKEQRPATCPVSRGAPRGTLVLLTHGGRAPNTPTFRFAGLRTHSAGVGKTVTVAVSNSCEWPVADNVPGPAAGKTLRRPHHRHTIKGSVGSEVKESNTVILDGMQKKIDDDIKGIAEGRAKLDPDGNTYRINGRSYEVKSNGTVFPKEGPGLVKLDRVEYSALQLIAKGDAKSLKQLEMNPKFKNNPQAVEKARSIYEGTYS
ncbi:hypothetical protein DVK44_22865 [Streptomyces paludis]|uniref:Uncharacterized protein n=1 Tax=Streptomyces paludis TaxID=2282738 RepID=A0A345HTJ9_9ACTN|nr:hypothetical protein DVK44_22865 [Streptomyces paludis]